jgi:hypothetical protein
MKCCCCVSVSRETSFLARVVGVILFHVKHLEYDW